QSSPSAGERLPNGRRHGLCPRPRRRRRARLSGHVRGDCRRRPNGPARQPGAGGSCVVSKLHQQIPDVRDFAEKGEVAAYTACVAWLDQLACSTGSMQKGAPTAVVYMRNAYVSKYRNLGPDESRIHGWITGDFRNGPVKFEISSAGKAIRAKALE